MALFLEPDQKMKNVAKLVGWYSLAALEQLKRNMEFTDSLTFIWRGKQRSEYKVIMQNAEGCVNLVVKHLKSHGLVVNKYYDRKKKTEKELKNSYQAGINQIYNLLDKVEHYEEAMQTQPNSQIVQHLIILYNKVIEYYSALNDEKHLEYLQKLQRLFKDESIQRLMEITERGSEAMMSEESKKKYID
jgi:hypothetical protein